MKKLLLVLTALLISGCATTCPDEKDTLLVGAKKVVEGCFNAPMGMGWQNPDTGHKMVCIGVPPTEDETDDSKGLPAPPRPTPEDKVDFQYQRTHPHFDT